MLDHSSRISLCEFQSQTISVIPRFYYLQWSWWLKDISWNFALRSAQAIVCKYFLFTLLLKEDLSVSDLRELKFRSSRYPGHHLPCPSRSRWERWELKDGFEALRTSPPVNADGYPPSTLQEQQLCPALPSRVHWEHPTWHLQHGPSCEPQRPLWGYLH